MNYPKVSIIIPTFNRAGMLPATIDSFLNLDYPQDRYEIIVSDNGSKDNSLSIIDSYVDRYENIVKVVEQRNGVHFARNSAAKKSTGEILYFTDDDMVADPSLLNELVWIFEKYPEVGSATGKIFGQFEEEPPGWVRKNLINGMLSLTELERPEEFIISDDSMVYSCHQAIRRDLFFQCGGYNPENTAGVWIGDGESGLAYKIQNAGFKFAYNPKSLIYHVIPSTRMTLAYLINRVGNQGFCDSYTEYRRHRSLKILSLRLLERNLIDFVLDMVKTSVKVVCRSQSWRFIPARLVYYWRRNRYDFKLLLNEQFRDMVEVDNWLDEDNTRSWQASFLKPKGKS